MEEMGEINEFSVKGNNLGIATNIYLAKGKTQGCGNQCRIIIITNYRNITLELEATKGKGGDNENTKINGEFRNCTKEKERVGNSYR